MSSDFDILPPAFSDILLLLTFLVGPGGVIVLFLNQRQANKKLRVEEIGAGVQNKVAEGSLTVDQFNAALPAYKDLLDRADKDREAALDKMAEYKDELDEVKEKQDRLVKLFTRVVKNHRIQLTREEMEELEATRPPAVRRHRPRST
jgi:hypothetical protein